jgi:3',5'-cyclic AMP phosphodiesterase CpdA
MIRIAHLSDPHINLKYHPTHLPRLRKVLTHALTESRADHIVITGDISSNAEQRDLQAARRLFQELGILHPERLSLVIGNHDIYGGPHLAEDLLSFPGRCNSRDYDKHVQDFYECYAETFVGTFGPLGSPFPFAKILGPVAILGLNSIARSGTLKNPVGSNGKVSDDEMEEFENLLKRKEVAKAEHRIVLLHHHLFRRKDEGKLHTPPETNQLVHRFEHATLKLRGKRTLFNALNEGKVGAALHGHIHFTGDYYRKGVLCLNGGGAVYPVNTEEELKYNLLTFAGDSMESSVIEVNSRRRQPVTKLPDSNGMNGNGNSNGKSSKEKRERELEFA